MISRVKKIPIEITWAEFWKVWFMPPPAPRASAGRLFITAARFGEALINATSGSGALPALEGAGAEALGEKILLDLSNPLDFSKGFPPTLTVSNTDSMGEVLQRAFPRVRLVKTLNHIGYHDLETDARPAGGADRHALAIAGDADAASVVAEVIDRFGFDPVYAGPLAAGVAFEPGSPVFGGRHTAAELTAALEQAAALPLGAPSERAAPETAEAA